MIKPTIGRVVWFWSAGKTQKDAGEQPNAAIIAYVHSDTCVNLTVFDCNGNSTGATSVFLHQEGGENPENYSQFCEWMPYQKGQAAKTEQVERELSDRTTRGQAEAKREGKA